MLFSYVPHGSTRGGAALRLRQQCIALHRILTQNDDPHHACRAPFIAIPSNDQIDTHSAEPNDL